MSYLQTADDLVNGPRAHHYGHPLDNHDRIARIWSVILGVEVTPDQVALCMVGTKVARLANDIDHEDSWIDIAGYVACVERIRDERARRRGFLRVLDDDEDPERA